MDQDNLKISKIHKILIKNNYSKSRKKWYDSKKFALVFGYAGNLTGTMATLIISLGVGLTSIEYANKDNLQNTVNLERFLDPTKAHEQNISKLSQQYFVILMSFILSQVFMVTTRKSLQIYLLKVCEKYNINSSLEILHQIESILDELEVDKLTMSHSSIIILSDIITMLSNLEMDCIEAQLILHKAEIISRLKPIVRKSEIFLKSCDSIEFHNKLNNIS